MQNMIQLQDNLKNFSDQQLVREMQMPSGQVPQFLILTELGRRKRMKDDFSRQQAAGAPTVAEETVATAGMPVGASTDMAKSMAPKTSMAENTGIGTMMPKQPTRMADGGDVEPKNRFEMLMAYLRSLREKEEEPKPTSTNPSIAEMINFGGDYEPVKKAEGGVVKMRTGGLSFIPDRALPLGEGGYNRGTGRATVVDGVTVEILPDGRVVNARTGDTVPQEIAEKAIAKLTPNLTEDATAKAEAVVPTIYDTSIGMPTQADLNLRAQETAAADVFPNDMSSFDTDAAYNAAQEQRLADAARMKAINEIPTDKPTFTGDVLPYLGGVTKDLATSSIKAFGSPAENDMSNPYVSAIASALEGPTGTEEMAKFLENENFRFGSNADRFDSLGFTPITAEDGSKRFISPAGMVYDSDGKLISGGEAMQTVGVAQQQGEDFSKSPLGEMPLPKFGTNEVDAEGNVIPGTYKPFIESTDISGVTTPSVIEENVGKPLIDLLSIEEGSAPVTKVDESETRVSPATPAEDVVGETPIKLPVTTSGIEDFVEQEKFRTFDKPTVNNEDGDGDGDTPKPDPDLPGGPSGTGGMGGIEGQLADMLKDMEKGREQDKWLALANTGLALMASKQPTLGGALGEAGMKGMKDFQAGKQRYSKDKLAIMALQQRIDAAKLAASSRESASNAALARLGLSIDKENRLASQATIDNALDRLNALGGVDRIRMLQNADDLSPTEAQELVMLKGLYDTVFGGNTGAKAVNVAG